LAEALKTICGASKTLKGETAESNYVLDHLEATFTDSFLILDAEESTPIKIDLPDGGSVGPRRHLINGGKV
jgi:hypothetical protein